MDCIVLMLIFPKLLVLAFLLGLDVREWLA